MCAAHDRRFLSDPGPRGTAGKEWAAVVLGLAGAPGPSVDVRCHVEAMHLLSLLRMYAAPPTSHTCLSVRACPPTEHERASGGYNNSTDYTGASQFQYGPGGWGSQTRHGTRPPSHPPLFFLTRYEMIARIAVRSRCRSPSPWLDRKSPGRCYTSASHVVD